MVIRQAVPETALLFFCYTPPFAQSRCQAQILILTPRNDHSEQGVFGQPRINALNSDSFLLYKDTVTTQVDRLKAEVYSPDTKPSYLIFEITLTNMKSANDIPVELAEEAKNKLDSFISAAENAKVEIRHYPEIFAVMKKRFLLLVILLPEAAYAIHRCRLISL